MALKPYQDYRNYLGKSSPPADPAGTPVADVLVACLFLFGAASTAVSSHSVLVTAGLALVGVFFAAWAVRGWRRRA